MCWTSTTGPNPLILSLRALSVPSSVHPLCIQDRQGSCPYGTVYSNSKQTTKNYNCDKCHEWKIWPEITWGRGGAAMGWPALGFVIREASKGRCWLS